MATLEQGEAARNRNGTGNGLTVKKWGRHRPFPVPAVWSPNAVLPQAFCLEIRGLAARPRVND